MRHLYPHPARPASFIRLADGKVFVIAAGGICIGLIVPHADREKPHRRYRFSMSGRHKGYSPNIYRAVRWIVKQGR